MTHHALFVTGEWALVLSIIMFVCAALDAIKYRNDK